MAGLLSEHPIPEKLEPRQWTSLGLLEKTPGTHAHGPVPAHLTDLWGLMLHPLATLLAGGWWGPYTSMPIAPHDRPKIRKNDLSQGVCLTPVTSEPSLR